MRAKMNSRYPEDSNIIDFIEIKLLQLFEEYSALNQRQEASAIWHALDNYISGDIDVIFKGGEPYVINKEIDIIDTLESEE